MEKLFENLGRLALVPILIVYGVFCDGFVYRELYNWFVVSVFPMAPVITLWQMAGLMFFYKAIAYKNYFVAEKEIEWYVRVLTGMLNPWGIYGLGYIVKIIIS